MVSIMEIMQFCRLCLVKEQVNVPIFDEQEDIRQICEKITSCLPVKVSKEDELPKKICDGCLYKLELQYQFYNSTANAEKQLLTWLEQAKMDSKTSSSEITTSQTTVKQEKVEPIESTNEITEITEITTDPQSYMQQYQTDFQYKDSQVSNADIDANVSSNSDEPLAKRARRRRQASKPIPREVIESSDENDAGDSMMEMTVTKTEEESESDNEENVDDPEPAKYAAAGEDTEQPGPSGLGKGGTDAPFDELKYSEILSSVTVELTERKPLKDIKPFKNKSKSSGCDKKWSCKKCTDLFSTVRQLRKHRKETHRRNVNINRYNFSYNQPEGIYSCNNCAKKSRCQEEMEDHVQTHEPYVCTVCNCEFYSLYKFSVHNQSHDSSCFKCPLCDYQTGRKTAILRHINTNHLNKYIYNCNICGKGFEDAANFRDHQNGHAGAKAFSCIVCQKEFPFNRYLLAHQKRNHMVTIDGVLLPNQCAVCKRILSKPSNLEKHMVQHDAAFLAATHHLCDICGKGFARKDKLRLHYRMHTGIKPYKCSYCTKSFAKREYLIMHERIHSGEKPFACQFCGKAFNQRTSLKTHIRGHTGERPYVCHICKTGFISKNSLNLHFKACNG